MIIFEIASIVLSQKYEIAASALGGLAMTTLSSVIASESAEAAAEAGSEVISVSNFEIRIPDLI